MHEELLKNVGLSNREIKTYLVLLKNGEMIANEIAKNTSLIRTNVYDVINLLVQKGLVAYVIRNNKKYFRATEAEKLIDFVETQKKNLEETKEKIEQILPDLKSKNMEIKRPQIEIYEGKEGMKTVLAMSIRESLKTGQEILGISVQQEKCRLLGGHYHERWYNERAKYKIKSRYLMSSEERIIPVKYTQFKILPKEAKNPNEIFIFGNITAQFFFTDDLFTAIIIRSAEITNNYRNYFNFLWKLVK